MFQVLLSIFALLGCSTAVVAQSAATVAGRSIAQYSEQLDDSDRVVRLRAIRSLGHFGAAAGDALRRGLDHQDPAVRYLAAVQLGQIGGSPLNQAAARLEELAADESSLAVTLAASYALCRAGQLDRHLPALIAGLGHPARGVACSAAELIGRIGPPAAAAGAALQSTYQANQPGSSRGDYHLGGASNNALRKIQGEP